MSKAAGLNIRALSFRRRRDAAFHGFIAIALIGCSVLLTPDKVKDAQPWGVHFLRIVGIAFGLGIGAAGWKLWISADRADQGAAGEEVIAQDLKVLEQKGWKFRYGMMIRGIGDLDIIATSPAGRLFVIDVKSHGGTVTAGGEKLVRRYGDRTYQFEKDFIAACNNQADRLKALWKAERVIPVLCFSKATVNVPAGSLAGVYVVSRQRLIPLLETL